MSSRLTGKAFNEPGSVTGVLFQALHPIYLASASPRRRAFLADLGLPVTPLSPDDAAEPAPHTSEKPEAFAARAALAKARNVASSVLAPPHNAIQPVVIGADTVVALDGRIFGKPSNAAHALVMLKELSGRSHQVTTACALLSHDGKGAWSETIFHETTTVTMQEFGEATLKAYAHSGEPLDKAGAYAVQGLGAFLIKSLSGSWTNVVGLPLTELVERLLKLGIIKIIG